MPNRTCRSRGEIFCQEPSHQFLLCLPVGLFVYIQSNIDGSFTMANSNSFLSPYEILPIAQENKYLRKFSYFIVKMYVVCTH